MEDVFSLLGKTISNIQTIEGLIYDPKHIKITCTDGSAYIIYPVLTTDDKGKYLPEVRFVLDKKLPKYE